MNIAQEKLDVAGVYRVIDANGNRAAEGLRVVEDFLRFSRSDAFLTETCKRLRHELQATLREFPLDKLIRCRSTLTDVGTHLQSPSEYLRVSTIDIASANLHRVMEALRVLEEYSKRVSHAASPAFEALRYQLYTLEKALITTVRAGQLLDTARLYVLADLCDGREEEFSRRIKLLVSAGTDVIQLRDKRASDRRLVAAARTLRQATRETDTKMIVNDRPDIAVLVQADGVHVGQDEMTIADVRAIVGPELLIGVSTHSLNQAQTAVLDGADYIGVGPVFASRTKTFDTLAGLPLVGQIAKQISLPAFAIGGIDEHNAAEVLALGMPRIAVGAAVWRAADPVQTVQQLKGQLDPMTLAPTSPSE